MTPKDVARFWSHIDRTGHPDECMEWRTRPKSQGGPSLCIGKKKYFAHRVAWCLAKKIPLDELTESTRILRTCGNQYCVNFRHLFEKSKKSYLRDLAARHFTPEDVREIRNDPRSRKEIAKSRGCDPSTISNIVRRKTWASVRDHPGGIIS